jgi:hypothetical protein
MKRFLGTMGINPVFALFASLLTLTQFKASAQQLDIRQFVLFGSNGVTFSSSTKTTGNGSVGSNKFVKTNGGTVFGGSINSGGKVDLSSGNSVSGSVTAANTVTPLYTGNIVSIGSGASISGGISVNGNLYFGGGTVGGPVKYSGTFSGIPIPNSVQGIPVLPTMPALPTIKNFAPTTVPNVSVTNTATVGTSISYKDITLSSNGKTITFPGPGIYTFGSIKCPGNNNKFIFDFNGQSGIIVVNVHGDVDLGKLNVELRNDNGTGASRIFMEVHGTGSTSANGSDAWYIANGSSGPNQTIWYGTVWAPNGTIDVGAGSNGVKINGSLISGKEVIMQSNTTIAFAALQDCGYAASIASPANLTCSVPSTTLSASTTAPAPTYFWSTTNGSILSNGNTANPVVGSGGTYVVKITSASCAFPIYASTTVTFIPCVLPYYPPPTQGKIHNIIGAELNSLFHNFGNVNDDGKTIFVLDNNKVLIDVIAKQNKVAELLALLQTSDYGMTNLVNNGPGSLIITGKFPVANLSKLDLLPNLISYARPSFPPVTGSGLVQSEGDSAMRSRAARNGFKVAGENIKIGVLSDSYNTQPLNPAQVNVDNGDLPGTTNPNNTAPVELIGLGDYPFGIRSDEGRAMMQIIHDVAPKAKLAFRTGFLTAGDMAQGILELKAANCNIITDDITYITEPFFRPGVVANAVQTVTNQGATYITAAGNFGIKSYEGVFQPAAPPAGLTGRAHNFGGGDIYQNCSVKGTLLKPGVYTIALQWVDDIYSLGNSAGTQNDLDIYLTDNNGVTLFGYNRDNLNRDPFEILPFTVTENTTINILIVNNSALPTDLTSTVRFKYVVFRGDLTINEFNQGNSTIVGQGNAPEAITVGAVRYTRTPSYNTTNGLAFTPEEFSSKGGTLYNGIAAVKPDLTAPDGVNTTVDLGSLLDPESDGIPNFFGTSAAAPHVAGAAALIMEARQKFFGDNLTPDALKTLLKTTSLVMGSGNTDLITGAGLVQVDAALKTMAKPTPELISVTFIDPNVIPGSQATDVTVKGNYLSNNTQFLLNGTALPMTIVNETTRTVTLPIFSGTKSLVAYTPPISPLMNDGGYSNSIILDGVTKRNIKITVNNAQKKYGEKLPVFTSTVLADELPLTDLNLTQLGLLNIQYTTTATENSNVEIYSVTPSRIIDPNDPQEAGRQELYTYTFVPGALNIRKLQVTVVPLDKDVVYGQDIGFVQFNYEFDSTNMTDPGVQFNAIKSAHELFLPVNTLAVISGFSNQLADGTTLSFDDLNNLSAMASFQATANARFFDVNANGQILPAVNVNLASRYLVDVSAQSLSKYLFNNAFAPLTQAYPGINSRAMISSASLSNGTAQLELNGQILPAVNGQILTCSERPDPSGREWSDPASCECPAIACSEWLACRTGEWPDLTCCERPDPSGCKWADPSGC